MSGPAGGQRPPMSPPFQQQPLPRLERDEKSNYLPRTHSTGQHTLIITAVCEHDSDSSRRQSLNWKHGSDFLTGYCGKCRRVKGRGERQRQYCQKDYGELKTVQQATEKRVLNCKLRFILFSIIYHYNIILNIAVKNTIKI